MSKNALAELSAPRFLSSIWDEMFKASKPNKRDGYGLDGISLSQFKSNEDDSIERLSSAIRTKCYKPRSLSPHFIPKPDGKGRVICVPSVSDRLVQRALIKLLHDKGYGFKNSISYGFVKDRSVSKAAKQAIAYRKNKPWAYKADISAFFDTIDRNILIERAKKKIRLRSLHPIISAMINTEIYHRHNGIENRIKKLGIKTGIGLRQGMPISPYFANLMLIDFDRKIESSGIPMVRYADDLIAFGDSEQECIDIHNKCTQLLAKESLHIHPLASSTKTLIAEPSQTIDFLGLGFAPDGDSYKLIVTDKQRNSIKQKVLELSNLDYCIKQDVSISKLTRKLEDTISGYQGAYGLCSNYEQLLDTLEAAKTETMTRLFINQFGIKYKSLSNKQKKFLEIY